MTDRRDIYFCSAFHSQFPFHFYGRIEGAVMHRLETITLPKFKNKLWVRYVDDVFTIVKKTDITTPYETLNQRVLEGTHFTVEEEKDSLLPFLDVAVHRTQSG